jgi:hypothetical protein
LSKAWRKPRMGAPTSLHAVSGVHTYRATRPRGIISIARDHGSQRPMAPRHHGAEPWLSRPHSPPRAVPSLGGSSSTITTSTTSITPTHAAPPSWLSGVQHSGTGKRDASAPLPGAQQRFPKDPRGADGSPPPPFSLASFGTLGLGRAAAAAAAAAHLRPRCLARHTLLRERDAGAVLFFFSWSESLASLRHLSPTEISFLADSFVVRPIRGWRLIFCSSTFLFWIRALGQGLDYTTARCSKTFPPSPTRRGSIVCQGAKKGPVFLP